MRPITIRRVVECCRLIQNGAISIDQLVNELRIGKRRAKDVAWELEVMNLLTFEDNQLIANQNTLLFLENFEQENWTAIHRFFLTNYKFYRKFIGLLEKDLETAGRIQNNIVPNGQNLFPDRKEVDAYALMNQAREVGGDFYDALVLDNDHIYIAIGEVSGKGMPASLFMMRTFTSLRLLISTNPGIENVIPSVNNWLARNNKDMMFASVFAGVLNIRTGLFRYVNCGHNPPFISQEGGNYKPLGLPKGTLIGILEQTPFPITEIQLSPGDSMLLYTDGIPEAMREDQVMFDMARTQKALNRGDSGSMEALVRSLEAPQRRYVPHHPRVQRTDRRGPMASPCRRYGVQLRIQPRPSFGPAGHRHRRTGAALASVHIHR